MKVNMFSIPWGEVSGLRAKLLASGLEIIKEVEQVGWHGDFYYSLEPPPVAVPWAKDYVEYFDEVGMPQNLSYYATFLFTRDRICYAFSHGKSHFYLRRFCDQDFGIELAKRIANNLDSRQTSSRRFQGKRKKDIRSFASNTRLDAESGESIDYLQAGVAPEHVGTFGRAGKFGSSALLSPNIQASGLGGFLDQVEVALARDARFVLPRTTVVSDPGEIEDFDKLLIDQLMSHGETAEFTHNSYDLYGVDFIFATDGTFKLRCMGQPEASFEDLTMDDLKGYITANRLSRSEVLKIKVTHEQEGRPRYTEDIKHSLDFIIDDQRVILSNGKWMRFNQDYLDFLNDYLRSIRVEDVESQFAQIALTEPNFNKDQSVLDAGYECADKNFDIFRTRSSTPVEAWDLKKGTCVYAVKFGTPQKLGYVCDQATALLELFRNAAEVSQVPHFQRYCLWLGYQSKVPLSDITGTGSIILKQKIEAWARKARDLGIEPVMKISQKVPAQNAHSPLTAATARHHQP